MKEVDFIDTNILVYAYDHHYPRKQRQAGNILLDGIRKENTVISPQVLGEFFTVITRKIQNPLSVKEAGEIIECLGRMTVQDIDYPMVGRAMDTCEQYNISYWDSLIIAAAERAGCKRIVSEDLNSGQTCHGIQVINPFI